MARASGSLLYRIQGAILDQLTTLGFPDIDGFAAELADSYLSRRSGTDKEHFLKVAGKIRTGTFARARRQRKSITQIILERLDKRFLPDLGRWRTPLTLRPAQKAKVRGLVQGARRPASGRLQFDALLHEYRKAIELNGIPEFWKSRKRGELRANPESLAQHSLSMFLHSPVRDRNGFLLREVRTGIGFVDVLAVFGRSRQYLVELKILTSRKLVGLRQLARYLDVRGLSEGWLVVFDARPPKGRSQLCDEARLVKSKTIRVLVIDINPPRPSSLN